VVAGIAFSESASRKRSRQSQARRRRFTWGDARRPGRERSGHRGKK